MPPLSDDFDATVPAVLALSAKLRNHEVEMKRYRKVTFHDNVSVRVVDRIPREYRGCYWMSKIDFERIKLESAAIVDRAKSDPAVDIRGLERSVMPAGLFLQRYLHKRAALRAVLKEQSFQRETGYNDPDDIADAYIEYSCSSRDNARQVGENDEVACQE